MCYGKGKGTLAEVLGDKELDPAITGEDSSKTSTALGGQKTHG